MMQQKCRMLIVPLFISQPLMFALQEKEKRTCENVQNLHNLLNCYGLIKLNTRLNAGSMRP